MKFCLDNHTPSFSPLDMLRSTRSLSSTAIDFISLAFSHGAYVAGGFGILMARHRFQCAPVHNINVAIMIDNDLNVQESSDSHYVEQIVNMKMDVDNLLKPYILPDSIHEYDNEQNKGDVDLFFQSQIELNKFLNHPRVQEISLNTLPTKFPKFVSNWKRPSVMNYGWDFVFNNGEKVQVITKQTLPIREQLSSFDIFNSFVSFNDRHFIYADGWIDYERERTLHVQNWSQNTLGRVIKYMEEKGYVKATTTTSSIATRSAITAINNLSHESNGPGILNIVKPRSVLHSLKILLPHFTNEQLLHLAAVSPKNNYNLAFKELVARGAKQS
jgi:hypothetical protein